MHGRFEKPGNSDSHASQNIGIGFLILPVAIAIILASIAVFQPAESNWIAEAVQAEFIGDTAPSPVKTPTQLAQPAAPQDGTANWFLRIQTAWRGQR